MIKLYSSPTAAEAHYVCALLKAEGIRGVVVGETLGFGRGDLPLTQETQPAVFIEEKDSEEALAIVQQYIESGKGLPGDGDMPLQGSWTCSGCGEDIEPQFGVCWKCGREHPDDADGSTA